ncbi:MAG: sigma factor-like helix-turn-helix DNA-binding protein [Eubacteriales bacterium]
MEIIEMLYFENLTQREIAERMSCSQQNIAKKIEKIKKILK